MKLHQLTVDRNRCRGVHLCHQCEALQPGLVHACERQGHITIQEWAARERGQDISALARCCPDRAIMIRPVEGPADA